MRQKPRFTSSAKEHVEELAGLKEAPYAVPQLDSGQLGLAGDLPGAQQASLSLRHFNRLPLGGLEPGVPHLPSAQKASAQKGFRPPVPPDEPPEHLASEALFMGCPAKEDLPESRGPQVSQLAGIENPQKNEGLPLKMNRTSTTGRFP